MRQALVRRSRHDLTGREWILEGGTEVCPTSETCCSHKPKEASGQEGAKYPAPTAAAKDQETSPCQQDGDQWAPSGRDHRCHEKRTTSREPGDASLPSCRS